MISFYPGPSKLTDHIEQYLADAVKSGILSINHRQEEFVRLVEATVLGLKEYLKVPKEYEVYFVNSATECWYIIGNSIVDDSVAHLYNGDFGKKWSDVDKNLGHNTLDIRFDINKEIPTQFIQDVSLICLTHCETSNGTILSDNSLSLLRKNNSEALIALDATSSMGGVRIDFTNIDLCFASVQKCFGLPSGLGILICSPRAVKRATELNRNNYFHHLKHLHEKALLFQTCNTPNMLGIYLLNRVLKARTELNHVENALQKNARLIYQFFDDYKNGFQLLVRNESARSPTVVTVLGDPSKINQIKLDAKSNGIILGNGYGEWAKNTFRIANFPAHNEDDFLQLFHFFNQYK